MLPTARERFTETDRETAASPGSYESLRHPWIRVVDDGAHDNVIEPPIRPTVELAA